MTFEIREVAFGSGEYRAACVLRDEILRRPLGLALGPEDVQGEDAQWHLLAFVETSVAGCLLLVPASEGLVKMRQVAIASHFQRTGIGTALVRRAEGLSRERGFSRMVLHARVTAVPFYERLGYEVEGEGFIEVTVPHRRMIKSLDP